MHPWINFFHQKYFIPTENQWCQRILTRVVSEIYLLTKWYLDSQRLSQQNIELIGQTGRGNAIQSKFIEFFPFSNSQTESPDTKLLTTRTIRECCQQGKTRGHLAKACEYTLSLILLPSAQKINYFFYNCWIGFRSKLFWLWPNLSKHTICSSMKTL